LELECLAAARRADWRVGDVAADGRRKERDDAAVLGHRRRNEVAAVRAERGGIVRVCRAREEQGVLAGPEDEELRDLVPESLCAGRACTEEHSSHSAEPTMHGPFWREEVRNVRPPQGRTRY